MHIIAVSNRKGGTGKSTVSVNIAAEMAAAGKRVLLIDLDSQGHCAVGLGIKSKTGELTAHHIFQDATLKLSQTIKETPFARLDLAPADQLFEHGSGLRDTQRLLQALADEDISQRYDIVVLDTPPSLDMLLLNALSAATWVLVPYVPHHLSYEGLRQLMRVLFKVMTAENRKLKILGFLPMMATQNVRQHRFITGEISRQFGALRVLPGIRTDIRLAESFAAGKPIRHYSVRCRGAADFSNLVKLLLDVLDGRNDNPGQ